MIPSRPNEGIDVEAHAEAIICRWTERHREKWRPQEILIHEEIIALCTKVRAETEAAVTKRERERILKDVLAIVEDAEGEAEKEPESDGFGSACVYIKARVKKLGGE